MLSNLKSSKSLGLLACFLAGFSSLTACSPIGSHNMRRDRLAYDREVARGDKQEMLLNIVRQRFADVPTMLRTTQIIAGYSYQRSMGGNISGGPWSAVGAANLIGGNAGVSLTDNPTLTYQPAVGEAFSNSMLVPISPGILVPLFESNAPIDVILTLMVQSIGTTDNVRASGGENDIKKAATHGFSLVASLMRELQVDNALQVRTVRNDSTKDKAVAKRAFLVLPPSTRPDITQKQKMLRRELGLPPNIVKAEILYGEKKTRKDQLPIVTRSLLTIMSNVGSTILVPKELIKEGKTGETITRPVVGHRMPIIIHAGKHAPSDAFVKIPYEGYEYWIKSTDYPSKEAFVLVELINSLATTVAEQGAIVTIPTH